MKRLFSYIVSIALIFLILASCTDANKGISEEEQLDADLKAVGIIDSLGYGSLVVQAVYDKENGLSFSSADSSTLYIEFTNYRGKALQPDGDIEEMGKCERAFEHVDALLAKCRETVRIEVTVSAPQVHLFDMQRAVGMIQTVTGISEND